MSKTLTTTLGPGRYTRDEVVALIEQINKAMAPTRRWYWPFVSGRGRILKLVTDADTPA